MRKAWQYTLLGAVTSPLAQPALAQTVSPPIPAKARAEASNSNPSGAVGTTDVPGRGEIADIVVTAQRVSATAQKTSLVITAIDAKNLVGVTDVRSLEALVPGVRLSDTGANTQTFIRGVGSLNVTATQESAIAYNADGVYLTQSTMISPIMFDLQRVEILKGPQGTLYGRNASGGAVNLISRGASLSGVEGYLEAEAGNFSLIRGTGALNVPITGTLAIRVAAQHSQHAGYLSDGTDDQDTTSGRIRVLWQPTPKASLRLGVDGSASDETGAGSSLNANPTGIKFLGGYDPQAQTGPFFLGGTSLLSSTPNPQPFFHDRQWSAFGQLDVNLGFANVTVLPAYRHEAVSFISYINGYESAQSPTTNQRSLEIRLAHQSNKLKWLVGGYYLDTDIDIDVFIRNESIRNVAFERLSNNIKAAAVFGEMTYSLTDAVRLIGGLRYTYEKTSSNGYLNNYLGPVGFPFPQTSAFNPYNPVTNPGGERLDYLISRSVSYKPVTWKVGAEMDLAPDSMVFATASRGSKGGGTYPDVPSVNATFRPEYVTAFELGSRNRFFDRTLQLNLELFYWKLKDQQIGYLGFNSIGQPTLLTSNAGQAHMYGADVDLLWKASPNDTFHVGLEYLASKYDDFKRTAPSTGVRVATVCGVTGYVATPGSLAPAVIDCSGQQMLRAPKWSGSVSYQHLFELGKAGQLTFDLNTSFASSSYLDVGYTSLLRQTFYAIPEASLTYNVPGRAGTITAWIKNIGDQRVMSGGTQSVNAYARPTLLPPRTFGVTYRYSL